MPITDLQQKKIQRGIFMLSAPSFCINLRPNKRITATLPLAQSFRNSSRLLCDVRKLQGFESQLTSRKMLISILMQLKFTVKEMAFYSFVPFPFQLIEVSKSIAKACSAINLSRFICFLVKAGFKFISARTDCENN